MDANITLINAYRAILANGFCAIYGNQAGEVMLANQASSLEAGAKELAGFHADGTDPVTVAKVTLRIIASLGKEGSHG